MNTIFLSSNFHLAGRLTNLVVLLHDKCALAKAWCYDRILGIETAGFYTSIREDFSLHKDMVSYQPTPYGRLEKMLTYLKLTSEDIFVDLGCGKGRTVLFVALRKVKKVVGVELNKDLIDIARKNLDSIRINKAPIELFHGDAANFDVKDESIFFMFNPFGQLTIEKVVNNIRKSLITKPRKVRIVYYAPAHRHLLDNENWLVLEGKIENANCLVWSNKLSEKGKGS